LGWFDSLSWSGDRRRIEGRWPVGPTARISQVTLVRQQILDLVDAEQLRPGDQLPAEQLLSEMFDVGRSTTREALKLLEQEGIVSAVQGKGRFLSPTSAIRVERPITEYESITEMLTGLGRSVTTIVLKVAERTATDEEASRLEVAPGTAVIGLLRLRCEDSDPLILNENVVVKDLLPGPVAHRDWSGSLTDMLAGHGHRVGSSTASVSATEMPERFATPYKLADYGSWLLIREVCYDMEGRPAFLADDYHRGTEFAFNVVRRRT
jgi:DNA-binding GntR family transcriptional regulator